MANEPIRRIVSRVLLVVIFVTVIYVTLGLGFHIAWKQALNDCRQVRVARGEFVEPEVFSSMLSLVFNVTYWPIYAWANFYHDGTIFATPCTHRR